MADERKPPTDDYGTGGRKPSSLGSEAGGQETGGAADDATRPVPVDQPTSTFDPFADDDDEIGGQIGDEIGDETGDDATRGIPADADGGATDPMPASEPTQRAMPDIWAARVPVPPVAIPEPEPRPSQWEEQEYAGGRHDGYDGREHDRSRIRPVLITLLVAVLLAMLGTGLWLIFSRYGAGTPSVPGLPAPAASTVTPSATTGTAAPTATAPTAAPTATAGPTTQAPAPPPPTPTTAVQVAVPNVIGLTVDEAARRLTAVGLTYQITGAKQGTVIATTPGPGAMVDKGAEVTLVVAPAPVSSQRPAPSSSRGAVVG